MPSPLAKCAKSRTASGEPVHRKQRQGEEDARAGVHFQGQGAEEPLPGCIAAHRPREAGRIGGGERRADEPGRLPVGLQRNLHLFEQHAAAHQSAAHLHRTRFQIVDGDPRGDSSLLAVHREEGVADGLAGPHHGLADGGEVEAEHPAEGIVRDHLHRSRHQIASPVGRNREHFQRLHLRQDR